MHNLVTLLDLLQIGILDCKSQFDVRTYVIHLLGTYVNILSNWLILWQNTLYL